MNTIKIVIAVMLLSILSISCSNDNNTKKQLETSSLNTNKNGLSVLETSINGPLKDYIEVVNEKFPVENYYSLADDKDDNKWVLKVKFKLKKKFNCKDFKQFGGNGVKIVFYDKEENSYIGNNDAKFQFIVFPSRSDELCTLLEGEVGSTNWITFNSSVWFKKGEKFYMNFPKEIKKIKIISGKEK